MSNYLKLGDWNAICDRCSGKFKASELKEEWTGFRVCKECYDTRHISDFYKVEPFDESVPWTRPEGADSGGTDINGNSTNFVGNSVTVTGDQTLTVGTDPAVQIWSAALTGNVTVTLDTTGAQVGDRFNLYRTGGGAFTFDIGGLKTSPASITFKAEVEYNGTAWGLVSYTTLGL